MPETLITQTTASTEVARPPVPQQGYSEWQIAAGIAGGIGGLLAAIASILVIVNVVRGWLRDGRGDDEKQMAPIRAELNDLRGLCQQFKTKGELAEDAAAMRADLEHEKAARKADAQASAGKFREHDAALVAMREGLARQEALIGAFTGAIGRLESALDRIAERFETRFDGLARLVGNKP